MVSRLISGLGDSFHFTAICWYTFTLEHNGAVTAIVLACYFVPRVLLAPLGGVLSDYFQRRKLMIYADLMRALLVLVIPILIQFWPLNIIGLLCAVNFALSTVTIVFKPSEVGVVRELISKKQLIKANGLLEVIASISRCIGPCLAGLLLTFLSISSLFYLDALSFVISAILLSFVQAGNNLSSKVLKINTTSFFKEQNKGFKVIFQNKLSLTLILTMVVSNLVVSGISMIILPNLSNSYLLGLPGFGALESALGLGMILGGLSIDRLIKRVNDLNLILGGLIIMASAYLVMSFASIFLIKIFCCFLAGFGSMPLLLVSISSLQLLSTAVNIGRVFSAMGTMVSTSILISLCVIHLMVNKFGVENTLYYSSLFIFIVAILFRFFTRRWQLTHLIAESKI
jgi:predicted MFS family arabinose efflux permease